jgi:hypothetical protein
MRSLPYVDAPAFVKNGISWTGGLPSVSDLLHTNAGKGLVRYPAGSAVYDQLSACLVYESEVFLGLGASTFSRALSTLRDVSAPWSLVGLYYSAFFSARLILGLLGCWIGGKSQWLEVDDSRSPRELVFRRTAYKTGAKGSHQATWYAYYQVAQDLQTWVDPRFSTALHPINSQETWFTTQRNKFNYQPGSALKLMLDFNASYSSKSVPACFPGELATAVKVASTFQELSRELARDLALAGRPYTGFGGTNAYLGRAITPIQEPSLRAFAVAEGIRVCKT